MHANKNSPSHSATSVVSSALSALNYCRYHPLEPAVWLHPTTQESYCGRCVDRDEDADTPRASSVIGGEELHYLGSAGDAPAFWDQLGTYLTYPLRWQILIYWIPLLLITGVLVASGTPAQWVGAVLALLSITHLGFSIMAITGDGGGPELLKTAISRVRPEAIVAQIFSQAVPVCVLVAAGMYASGFITHVAFVISVSLLPAMMLAAMLEQGSGGMSFQRWLEMISGVGGSYLLIVSFVVLLVGVNGIMFSLFYGELPDAISLPLLLAAIMYSLLVFYRLLGGVVHQFQRRLAYLPEGKTPRRKSLKSLDRSEQMIEMLAKDGRFDELEKLLRQLIKQRPQSFRYQELLGKLLIEKADEALLAQHADQMLEALVKAEDTARLLFVYGSHLNTVKDYLPASPLVRFALAKLLAERGEHENAARMLINLHNEHPQFPGLGDAYWFLSQLLHEELSQPELAAQCATFVYKTFPKHAEREKVELFLRHWKRNQPE